MRKKFVYFVLVPLIILLVVVYLFIDSWVASGLEAAGEAMTGAKVEFSGVAVSLSPIGLRWSRLQVADPKEPMKNLFETGKVQFALNFAQLLRGKYIVESMEVNDFIVGTPRTTSGALPKKPVEKEAPEEKAKASGGGPGMFTSLTEEASSALGLSKIQTPNFDLASIKKNLNTDSLLNPKNLESYRLVDSLHQQVQAASVQWQSSLKEFDASKQKLTTIESDVKAINVNSLKTIDQITTTLNTVQNDIKTVNEIKKTFDSQQKTLTDRVNQFTSSAKSIDDAVQKDYQHILSMARIPDVSMKGLATLILGKDIMATANTYLYWIDFARKNIPAGQKTEKETSPPRMKGQNIRFPEVHGYPKFWIKKVLVSGGTDKTRNPDYLYAKGEVLNITDNQHITGQPMSMELAFSKGPTMSVDLRAMFDRRKEEPLDTYKARLTGARIGTMDVGRSDFLPSKIKDVNADASIDVTVPGNKFDSDTRIQFSNLTFEFERDPRNTVERIVREVLQSVKAFQVNLRMWNPGNKFDVAFSTDLDDQIAARTKKVLGDEVARIQNDLKNQLNQRIAAKRKEYEALLTQKRDDVMKQLKAYQSLVNDKVALVENKQKELQKKIDDEKKKQEDALKKKGQDMLKGLFKKK